MPIFHPWVHDLPLFLWHVRGNMSQKYTDFAMYVHPPVYMQQSQEPLPDFHSTLLRNFTYQHILIFGNNRTETENTLHEDL